MSKKTSRIPLSMGNLEEIAKQILNKPPIAFCNEVAKRIIDSPKWDFKDPIIRQQIKRKEKIIRKIFEYASTENGIGFEIPPNHVITERQFKNKIQAVFQKENIRSVLIEGDPSFEKKSISVHQIIGLSVGKRFFFLYNEECYYVYLNEDGSIPIKKCNPLCATKAAPPQKWYRAIPMPHGYFDYRVINK